MAYPFNDIQILPSYAAGFTYMWTIHSGFHDALPWEFTVQRSDTEAGPWTDISTPLTNLFAWTNTELERVNKDYTLYYRVKLETPVDTYYSHVRTPYSEVDRREFLIIQDIMRRELLQQRVLAGVPGQVWQKAKFGPDCDVCIHPVSGDIINPECDSCYGTGIQPGYRGPYDSWFTFNTVTRKTHHTATGTGSKQNYTYTVRMIGTPHIEAGDVIIDTVQDKRYIVDAVRFELAIRRTPVIQVLTVKEAPVTDTIYRIDTGVTSPIGSCPGG